MFSLKTWLYQPVHFSFLLAYFAAGFLGGVLLSRFTETIFSFAYLLTSLFIVLGVIIFSRKWMIPLMIIAGLLCGLVRGSFEENKYQDYYPLYGTKVILQGVVAEDVQATQKGSYKIIVKDIVISSKKYVGEVWVEIKQKSALQRSDTVFFEGTLQEGFGSYAAAIYSADITKIKKGNDVARDIRDQFSEGVRAHIDEPAASLGLGIVTGQQSLLSPEFETQLKIAGLTHIIVASGYNLTILVRLARRLLEGVSKYLTALFGGSLIMSFMLVTGFSPSMVRAGLVSGFSLLAWYYGRRFNPFVLLVLVAAITVVINPMYIWSDVGWYLSFAAFFGVMIVAPLLHHYFFGEQKPSFIRQIIGETFSALVMTAPIIALLFSSFSTYALLANMLVVPFIPLVMITVFLSGVVGATILGYIVNIPAQLLLNYFVATTQWIAQLPGAIIELTISPLLIAVYYVLLSGGLVYMWLKTKHNFRKDNLIE